jgi:uncharacterized membrane protein YfcA
MIVAVIALTFALAGLVKGTIGLGLPMVAVGLLGLVMPPVEAAALLVVPSLVTNAWQLAAGPGIGTLLRRLWPMLLGIAAGTWLAAGSLTAGHAPAIAMGLALVAYGLFGLARLPLHVPPRLEPLLAPLVGLANGAITAATGTFVLPSVPYLGALGLTREDLIQALGLSFTVSTLALAAALGPALFRTDALAASLLALIPALLGMQAGTWLRARVHPATFRRWFFAGLVALGAHLALSNAL